MQHKFRSYLLLIMIALILSSGLALHELAADHTTATTTLSANPASGNSPLTVNFQIAVSPPSSAACAPDNYILRFGDGSSVSGDSSGPFNVSHTYSDPGQYVAELSYSMEGAHGGSTVICSPGSTSASASINATIGQELVAQFDVSQTDGPAPVDVQFNATRSTTDSACSPISSYSWDFGDGNSTGSGPIINHIYDEEGTYLVELTIRDLCGREVSAMREVGVGEGFENSDEVLVAQDGSIIGPGSQVQLPAPHTSDEQDRISNGVVGIHHLMTELDINLAATEAMARSFLMSGVEISDPGYQLMSDRIARISDFIELLRVEIEELEVLEEAEGTVFLVHLRELKELVFDDSNGIKIDIDRADENIRDQDLERFQFNLEEAIFHYQRGPNAYIDWSTIAEFGYLYRCRGVLATVSIGLINALNPSGPTVLDGTSNDDVILGTTGADIINGMGGDDLICGSSGDDQIMGGNGDDTIYGDDGSDDIWGDLGNDMIDTGQGINTAYGGPGHDQIVGGFGADTLRGGTGNDMIGGDDGSDYIYGEDGNDTLNGDDGNDTIYGGDDNDIIWGGVGEDWANGDNGGDELNGSYNKDSLYGGAGPDTLIGGSNDDQLYGGSGSDMLNGDEIPFEGQPPYNDLCVGNDGTDDAINCETEIDIP